MEKDYTAREKKKLADAIRGLSGSTEPNPQQDAALSVLQGMPLEQMQGVAGQQAAAKLFPAPQKLTTVDLGGEVGMRDEGGNIVNRIPKTAAPQGKTSFERELEKVYAPDSPEYKTAYDAYIKKQTSHSPAAQVTVDTKQETEENKAVGKAFGEQYTNILKGGFDSAAKLDRLDRMEYLLDGLETGKLTPAMTEVASFTESLGIKLDPNLDQKQAAEQLSNEMALQARNPSGGAGMPGALSDKDREFLVKIVPGLNKTPGGNKLIIETSRKLAKRDQEVAELARQYRADNGRLDEGFYKVLADFSAQNPLFGGEGQAPKQRFQRNPDGSYSFTP
jgi:hypothetical protein